MRKVLLLTITEHGVRLPCPLLSPPEPPAMQPPFRWEKPSVNDESDTLTYETAQILRKARDGRICEDG